MARLAQSDFAARLQNVFSQRRREAGLYGEIAEKLPLPESGRVLDIGAGSGFQLQAIHQSRPGLELYGLEISGPAVKIARANLVGLNVRLKQGSIEKAPYRDNFFDLVTCHSSMSYWKQPAACFNEVFRILKPGGTAVLFEPRQEVDSEAALAAIRANMAGESTLQRFLATSLLKFTLRHGHRFGLHRYKAEEISQIIAQSDFGHHFEVEESGLLNVPVYLHIRLEKPQGV
jgi:ubiquinone/menaquinone biosynthesis C-methylase UbiE